MAKSEFPRGGRAGKLWVKVCDSSLASGERRVNARRVRPNPLRKDTMMFSHLLRWPRSACPDPLPRRWLGGDPLRTQVFNALSMSFPAGEQFFIDSVRRVADQLSEPALAADVRAFIGQESIHRKQHGAFNQALAAQGLVNVLDRLIAWRVRRGQHLSALQHLAITAAYEHFTAVLGESLLTHPHWLDGAEPHCRTLWLWHALEELEHQSVALTVYRSLGGGEAMRRWWYGYASLWFAVEMPLQVLLNLWRDGSLWRWRTWYSARRFLFGRDGVLAALLRRWPDYLRQGYAPDEAAAAQLLAPWLAAQAPYLTERPAP